MEEVPVPSEACCAGSAYKRGELDWVTFMRDYGSEHDDALVSEVVYLIEHEPKRGGLLGVNERRWVEYQQELDAAIRGLENE